MWMNSENMMLKERKKKATKDKYFYELLGVVRFIETESKIVVVGRLEHMRELFVEYGFTFAR